MLCNFHKSAFCKNNILTCTHICDTIKKKEVRNMETKDILKQLRIDAGLTQKQISENSGVSYSAYQKYESGERELGANSLKKLADYYHKTTDLQRFRAEGEPYPYQRE